MKTNKKINKILALTIAASTLPSCNNVYASNILKLWTKDYPNTDALIDVEIDKNGAISVLVGKDKYSTNIDGKRIDIYTSPIQKDEVLLAIEEAEANPTEEALAYARRLVNEMSEGELKEQYQARLNSIGINVSFEPKSASANVDIYVKCENMISLSLDTSSVTFDDFNGTEDLIKDNAVKLTVSSSLPYKVDAYLATEIQNASKTNTMDKEILNIKTSESDDYKIFTDVNLTPITLLDNQEAGNDKLHSVDIKLKGGIPHQKDIYKTTVRFEASQK